MKMLSKRALALMAIILLAATAATAATALAADKKRLRASEAAIESVSAVSQAQLRAKVNMMSKRRSPDFGVIVRIPALPRG